MRVRLIWSSSLYSLYVSSFPSEFLTDINLMKSVASLGGAKSLIEGVPPFFLLSFSHSPFHSEISFNSPFLFLNHLENVFQLSYNQTVLLLHFLQMLPTLFLSDGFSNLGYWMIHLGTYVVCL